MTMNKHEFLVSAGLQVELLDFWVAQQWLVPMQSEGGETFSDVDLARAHFIRDMKADLGINDEGVDVILHLVDQLHGLRRALQQLHRDHRVT
jgi:chaperone modulatory protein CbpM